MTSLARVWGKQRANHDDYYDDDDGDNDDDDDFDPNEGTDQGGAIAGKKMKSDGKWRNSGGIIGISLLLRLCNLD